MTLSWPQDYVIPSGEWEEFLSLIRPLYARKSSLETRVSDATASTDDDLYVYTEPFTIYTVRAFLVYDGAAAADFQHGWQIPSGASLDWAANTDGSSMASQFSVKCYQPFVNSDLPWVGTIGAGTRLGSQPNGLLRTDDEGGRFGLNWAQGSSNVTANNVFQGSFLILRKVGDA